MRGTSRATVLEALGLRPTGDRETIAESPIVGAELPGRWYLVIANRSGHRLLRDPVLERLSTGCEVVAGDVEEHVMVSTARGWRDRRRVWVVGHDGQRGVEHLVAEGQLPRAFLEIRDRARADQRAASDDVDHLFEVPVNVAKALTGYRDDEDAPGGGRAPFEVLAAGGSTSWLGRLFGR